MWPNYIEEPKVVVDEFDAIELKNDQNNNFDLEMHIEFLPD